MGAFVHCRLGLLAFLLSASFLTVKAYNCAQGWQKYNNKCYAYFDQKVPWNTAETRCQAYKGHLVSILSQKEVSFVYNIMAAYYNENDNVWIGLHVFYKPSGGSEYRWTDGSPYSFASWEYGAPHSSKPSKDCVGLTHNSTYMQWTNMLCATKKAYICKYSL